MLSPLAEARLSMKTPYPVSVALVMGTLVSAWPAFAADAAKGKEVFQTNCAACHGADGTGTEIMPTIPHLSNPEFLSVASPGLLKAMIENGRPGRPMPTWKGILGADQIADVVAYLKQWQTIPDVSVPPGPIHGDVRAGKAIFSTICATCHGVGGLGQSAPALNNPGFLKAASDGYLKKTLEIGRPGTPMRSFLGPSGLANLSDQDLNNVVAYIRSWQKK
jgi:cytochrome c oxidase cbb3-type subunit 3